MREPDRSIKLSRRGLLQGTVVTGAAVLLFNGTPLILGKEGAWAMELKALSPDQGATLMRFVRDLFPHDQLIDAIYASAIAPLDEEAAKDPKTKALLAKGLADLDARTMKADGTRFADTKIEATRIAVMKDIETTPFFKKVHGGTITPLYNNRDAWMKFGFEGPSSPYGGYLHRGFNDLDWL